MTSEPTSSPVRRVFGGVLREVVIFVVALTVVGSVVGFLVAGTAGLWGALLGAAVSALFSVTTAVIMYTTADKPMHVTTASLAGAWLGKMTVLFAVLTLLREQEFYDKVVFFLVLTVAILGSVIVEYRALLAARIPTIDLSARDDGPQAPDAP